LATHTVNTHSGSDPDAMRSLRRAIRWASGLNVDCALPWLAVAVVLATTGIIDGVIDLQALDFNRATLLPGGVAGLISANLQTVARHLPARIAWGLASIGFAVMALIAMGTALNVLGACYREAGRDGRLRGAAVTVGCAVLILAIVAFHGNDNILSEPLVTEELRKATIHRTYQTVAVAVDAVFDKTSIAIFLLLITASGAVLIWPDKTVLNDQLLRQRIGRTQSLLYVGAAALALRSFEMFFLYRWPGMWLSATDAKLVDNIASAVSTAHGAIFTGVLAALYLPAALLLRLRANALANTSGGASNEEREKWLENSGLKFSPYQAIGRFFLALAPLIAGGSAATVIDLLKGA